MADPARHATRMVRKKAVIDAALAHADQENGLLGVGPTLILQRKHFL